MAAPIELLLQCRRFKVVRQQRTLPSGTVITHESLQHPGAVAIVPVLPDGRICLIRNYRIAVGQTLLEIPAGTLEPGEPPHLTAERELIEETGYRAGKIEPLAAFFLSPGIMNEKMHVFLATDLVEGKAELEVGEEIETVPMTWDEIQEHLRRGEIQDAKTIAGLLLYQQRIALGTGRSA